MDYYYYYYYYYYYFVVFFCLGSGVEDENGQARFSSLEAFTFKLQGKTVSTILINHDFCQIA